MAKQTPRLKKKYQDEIKSKLRKELGKKNDMAVPTLTKIVVNAGVGKEVTKDSSVVEQMVGEITTIAGQKPMVTKSKKAISNFKLREDMDNGVMVTLRRDRMWDFYDKLVSVVLPRVRDFRGVSEKAFDKKGNYALGIREHTVFPEIDTSKMLKIRPLQVVICTSADNDDDARALLKELGMPFKNMNTKSN